MKNHSAKQTLILFLVLVVVLLAFHYVAFRFIKNSGERVVTLENEVSLLQDQVSEFSKYSVDDISDFVAQVNNRFVSKDDFVGFLQSIETEARLQGLEITVRGVEVQRRSEDEGDDKEFLKLQIETNGSWQDTMRFVKYLEYLPYKISIRDLGLVVNTEDGESSPVKWRGRIEMIALKFR